LRQLASQPGYLSFLGAMALLGIGTSTFVNFIGLHILEVGGDQQWLALAWSVNAIAEIPVMLLGGRWFARFRYSRLIQIGLAGYMVVWALMAFATVPWVLIVLTFANGLCYGTVWVSAVNYAAESAPPGLSATAQALIGAAQSGIGWSIGAVLAGYLWDAAGGDAAFVMAACSALAAGLLFWFGNRRTLVGVATG
jgi:MFS family permease